MGKPQDVPQWAWDKAQKTAKMASAPYNTPEMAHHLIARAILSAVQEEREACAKAAEWYADTNSEYLPEGVVIACGQTAADIASAIRNRKES